MSIEKMRSEFEGWVIKYAADNRYTWPEIILNRDGDEYATTWVDSAWIGWQASRAAIEVDLSDSPGRYYNGAPVSSISDPMQCWRDGYKAAVDRFADAGLGAKP